MIRFRPLGLRGAIGHHHNKRQKAIVHIQEITGERSEIT